MFGLQGVHVSVFVLEAHVPGRALTVKRAAHHFRAHQDVAPERFRFFRTGFPHHARAFARILERVNQRLDHLARVLRLLLWQERILDRAPERQALDALRRPIRRDFLARHPPHLFGVALEKGVEETLAKLVAHPILEVDRIRHRENARLHPGENAKRRLEHAQLHQCFHRLERISEKLPVVENSRGTRPIQHVVR